MPVFLSQAKRLAKVTSNSPTICDDVTTICQPLFKNTIIDYFEYARAYSDGSLFLIASRPEMAEYIEQEDMYCSGEELKSMGRYNYMTRYLLSPALNSPKYLKLTTDLDERHNITHSMIILDTVQKDYIEAFVVACCSSEHGESIDFYMNKIQVVEEFIKYFKNKASNLIAQSKYMSRRKIIPYMGGWTASDRRKNTVFLLDGSEILLTDREIACLIELACGYTMKEIAKILGLSHRTVEKYISRLKVKVDCCFKSQLIDFYMIYKSQIDSLVSANK